MRRALAAITGLIPASILGLACAYSGSALAQDKLPFERTEQREACADYDPLKKPLFGDTHVHTSYSFDAYISSLRLDPWDAYRYAKGDALMLPDEDGKPTVKAQIGRPIDFTVVTDHGEFLGQINICTQDASKLGYWWPQCMLTRADNLWLQLIAASGWTDLGGQQDNDPSKSFACSLSDCDAAQADTWASIQQAAEDHYDRSSECSFTTFVGYEYTDSPNAFNMHRNVIFRNDVVTDLPVTTYDTGRYKFPVLWKLLREQCIEGKEGCDVMSIAHNSNLAGGLMFRDPETPEEQENRIFFEPLFEIAQHKGYSECRFDRLAGRGVGTNDELCDFEQVKADNLSMLGSVHGKVRTAHADPVPIDKFARRNLVRNALKDGLKMEQDGKGNPFVMGFISATDTHSATPGATEEDNFTGHIGRRDAGYRNIQDHFSSNAGGHAVVWAEENSRDAIFAAMRRKETYATSGNRPVVRFFAGTELDENLCNNPDMIAQAYQQGVPMGGNVQGQTDDEALLFLVSAQKDPGTPTSPGVDLQRIQIIKGWVEANGETHERIYEVAGDPNNGATVDKDSCQPRGSGAAQLCTIWQDPDFNPTEGAFYYARVLDNPTCRWSTLQCKAAGVDPFASDCSAQAEAATAKAQARGGEGDVYGKCCTDPATEPFYQPIIQERAWTSPIWYKPGSQ